MKTRSPGAGAKERNLRLLSGAAVFLGLLLLTLASAAPDVVAAVANFRRYEVFGIEIGLREIYLTPWVLGAVAGAAAYFAVAFCQGTSAPQGAYLVFVVGVVYGANLQGRLEDYPIQEAIAVPARHLLDSRLRLPMGILIGGVMSLAFARLRGGRWLAVGDRLVVAAASWMAMGRIGCLLAGCCLGRVCPPQMRWLCLRYGPETQVHRDQVQLSLLDPESPLSLPVHVLPVYFSLASIAMLLLLVHLIRRGAREGSALVTFSVLYPVGKLLLEGQRLIPRPGPWMTAVPLLILLGGLMLVPRLLASKRAVHRSAEAPVIEVRGGCW